MTDDDLVEVTLTLPIEMVAQALATARRLSAEVDGPDIDTPEQAVRALVVFAVHTVNLTDAMEQRARLGSAKLHS